MTAPAVRRGADDEPAADAGEERLPRHVAIIMDGNRRWARAHGVPEAQGHAAGVEAIRPIVEHAAGRGIEVLTIYAFSRENWQRSSAEVETLIGLLDATIRDETPRLVEQGVRVRLAGRLEELPAETRASIEQAILLTAGGARMTLNVAFNYSSRSEIVDAVRAYVDDGNSLAELDEEGLASLSLHRGPARPGPAHPHRRRPAHQQLPALAGGLRGALLLRPLLAGLRSGRPRRRHRRVRPPRAAVRALGGLTVVRERAISAVVIAVVVVGVFLAGAALADPGHRGPGAAGVAGGLPPAAAGRLPGAARCPGSSSRRWPCWPPAGSTMPAPGCRSSWRSCSSCWPSTPSVASRSATASWSGWAAASVPSTRRCWPSWRPSSWWLRRSPMTPCWAAPSMPAAPGCWCSC